MAVSRALLEAFRRAGQTELSVRSAKSAARDARRLLRAGARSHSSSLKRDVAKRGKSAKKRLIKLKKSALKKLSKLRKDLERKRTKRAKKATRARKPTTRPTSGTLGASAPHGALRKGKRGGTYYVSDSGEKVYIQ